MDNFGVCQGQEAPGESPYLEVVCLAENSISFGELWQACTLRRGGSGSGDLRENQTPLQEKNINEKSMPHAARPVNRSNVRHG